MTDTAFEPIVARLRPLTTGWPDDLLDASQPAFLARRRADGHTSWYAVPRSPRQAREIRDQLLAFIGPSHSDFTGQPADWNSVDPVEVELAAFAPNGFRLTVHPADARSVEKLFSRLRSLLRSRPRRTAGAPSPVGRSLRDFELLIRTRDWAGAESLMQQMRQRAQLTLGQLAGLRLRLLASQERWAAVLAAPELPELLLQRLPAAVAEGIAAATFRIHLASAESEADAVERYRTAVSTVFGPLFRQRTAWSHSDATKAAAIADAAARVTTKASQPLDPVAAALAAHQADDAATAFRLLVSAPLNAAAVRLLVEVALDVGTLAAARDAVAAIRECDAEVREKAFSRRATLALWDELQDVAGTEALATPEDWLGWLERAAAGPWTKAAETARHGVKEWPRPDATAFHQAFVTHGSAGFAAIRDSLPALLEVLIPDHLPDVAFGPVYRHLLECVVLDDELTHAAAGAVRELAAAVLQSNPVAGGSRNDYAEVTESLLVTWQRVRGPRLLDWGLDLLDLLAEHAVHRRANVTPLVQEVIGEFARVTRHVTSGQRVLLQTICAELDLPGAADGISPSRSPAEASADPAGLLRKKLGKRSVVLLTLQDRIAVMFRELMRHQYPDARVEVLQDHAGTKRLRDLSATADIFIVNTFDAKHAATGYVSQNRSKDAITLQPEGKSAARQLDALENWLGSSQ